MKVAINLLPPAYRRQRFVRRRVIQWAVVLCGVLSTIWATRWYKEREYHTLRQQLEAISREGRPAQAMLHEITTMREQIQQLRRHEVIARELEQQRHVLALFDAVSMAARQSDGKLRVLDCRVVDLQAVDEGAEHGTDAPTAAGTVTLVGVSLDSPTVAEFHDALLRSGLFVDVKLIKSNERHEAGVSLCDYEVSCEL